MRVKDQIAKHQEGMLKEFSDSAREAAAEARGKMREHHAAANYHNNEAMKGQWRAQAARERGDEEGEKHAEAYEKAHSEAGIAHQRAANAHFKVASDHQGGNELSPKGSGNPKEAEELSAKAHAASERAK